MEAVAIEYFFESEDDSDESSSSGFSLFNTVRTESSFDSKHFPANFQKIQYFGEVINSYSNLDFKKHFRLHRSTVQILVRRSLQAIRAVMNYNKEKNFKNFTRN